MNLFVKRVISYYASFIYNFFSIIFNFYFCITPWTQDVNRMYRRCSRCLLKTLCTFTLHPLSRSYVNYMHDIRGLFIFCLAWICGVFCTIKRLFGFEIGGSSIRYLDKHLRWSQKFVKNEYVFVVIQNTAPHKIPFKN